jgi:hypothetical protein
MRKLFTLFVCSLSLAAQAGDLYTSRTVIEATAGHYVEAKLRFAQAVRGDVYLATRLNDQFLFLGPAGATPEVQAYLTDQNLSGEYSVLNVPADGLAPGRYPLYQVTVQVGGNVFNVNDWIGGFSGLNMLNFLVGLPVDQHGDRDGDGFSDMDSDRDGYYDDDHDRDGYHDDDHDRDGYYDDDHDRDGYHDDDHDRDGYYDDDDDRDGYHDDDDDRDGYYDDDDDRDGYHDDDHDRDGYYD